MYSEMFILKIHNPNGSIMEKYMIDYNGNDQPEIIKGQVKQFIKQNGYFDSTEFSEKVLNNTSCCTYLDGIRQLEVVIPTEEWDIDSLNIPF